MKFLLDLLFELDQLSLDLGVDVPLLLERPACVARSVAIGEPFLKDLISLHLAPVDLNLTILILVEFDVEIRVGVTAVLLLLLLDGFFDELLFDLESNNLKLRPTLKQFLVLR